MKGFFLSAIILFCDFSHLEKIGKNLRIRILPSDQSLASKGCKEVRGPVNEAEEVCEGDREVGCCDNCAEKDGSVVESVRY